MELLEKLNCELVETLDGLEVYADSETLNQIRTEIPQKIKIDFMDCLVLNPE